MKISLKGLLVNTVVRVGSILLIGYSFEMKSLLMFIIGAVLVLSPNDFYPHIFLEEEDPSLDPESYYEMRRKELLEADARSKQNNVQKV